MTDQTHAQLRERIAEEIHANVPSFTEMHICRDIADQIIALISPPDPGLASLVGEIDRLVAGATSLPWQAEDGDSVVKIVSRAGEALAAVCSVPYWKRFSDQDSNHAALIIALVNNWPLIRQALTTGGSGWRPDYETLRHSLDILMSLEPISQEPQTYILDGSNISFLLDELIRPGLRAYGHYDEPLPPEPETGGG